MEYLSIEEFASKFQISFSNLQKLCEFCLIDGATLKNHSWVIPEDTTIPKLFSLKDLCDELSVSLATGRNWMKLGKLSSSIILDGVPYFSETDVLKIKKILLRQENMLLKTGRNKKYVSGSIMYRTYLSSHSKNISVVRSILNDILEKGILVTEVLIRSLLTECALQLILQKEQGLFLSGCFQKYLHGEISALEYSFLIDDLFPWRDSFSFPTSLFDHSFFYEEGEDVLGFLYISLKSLDKRKAEGVYYTPTRVVEKLCSHLFSVNDYRHKTVLDPCCGTGNFLLQLPKDIPFDFIYGNDLDFTSVQITRINMALKYHVVDREVLYHHFQVENYLEFDCRRKYDFIIGNPPWGYAFSEEEKSFLRRKFQCAYSSTIESYDVFIEQGLSNLNPGGILSFVLPEAILNVYSHVRIRDFLLHNTSFQYLEYLGNAFDGVQCPSIILQLTYTRNQFSSIGLQVNDGKREYLISLERKVTPEFFSFLTTDQEYSVLEKISSRPLLTTLKNQADFALGIVTGDNKNKISSYQNSTNEVVLKGADLRKFRYISPSSYLVFEPKLFQQVADVSYYRAEEKLLYRFVSNQLVFAYDNKQTSSLNSANILIPKIPGLSIKYIMAILNSRVAQFFFYKNFHSVKVLKSHIEQIPIPKVSSSKQRKIEELVDLLLKGEGDLLDLYDELDFMIAKLFYLTKREYQVIFDSLKTQNLFL